MINKDVFIVDFITKLSQTEIDNDLVKRFNIVIKNVRKYRERIEKRKEKVKKIYD
jgi:hypothetical protein